MIISFYSIVNSFIWLNLFILLCAIMKRSTNFMMKFGFTPILFMIACGVLRLLFAVEFPFTQIIGIPAFAKVQLFVRETAFSFSGYAVSISKLLLTLWLGTALILLIRMVLSIRRQRKSLLLMQRATNENAKILLDKLALECHIRSYELIVSEDVEVPYMTGFFKPVILIPNYLDMPDEELKHIMRHELHHYLNHDIWIKLFINIFCIVFWWNPLVYIIKHDLDNILEMRCDCSVTKDFADAEKLNYVETALKAVKRVDSKRASFPVSSAGLFSSGNSETIRMRFQYILGERKEIGTFVKTTLLLATFCLMLFSYTIIAQAEGYPDTENFVEITSENSYIKFENGIYMLYVDDEPFFILPEDQLGDHPHNELQIIR